MCAEMTITNEAFCMQPRPAAVQREAAAASVPLCRLPERQSKLKFRSESILSF